MYFGWSVEQPAAVTISMVKKAFKDLKGQVKFSLFLRRDQILSGKFLVVILVVNGGTEKYNSASAETMESSGGASVCQSEGDRNLCCSPAGAPGPFPTFL